MPANHYRLEIKVSRATKARLERLKREFEDTSDKSVSLSSIVASILDSYLEKLPDSTVEERKLI